MKFFLLITIFCTIFYFNRVDNTLTVEDKIYISKYTKNIQKINKNRTFEEEIEFIKNVQDVVLLRSPLNKPMPFDVLREPKDVYISRLGSCVERSRIIEKILRSFNFQVRHVSIYSTIQTKSKFISLITPNNPSHAVTEIRTLKGWIVIDSNYRWVAKKSNGQYLNLQEIQNINSTTNKIDWNERPIEPIFNHTFTYVYGLYSRHGKYYPPFNFIPDINWNEFLYNITEYLEYEI